jgi:nitrate reductase gamma subunit
MESSLHRAEVVHWAALGVMGIVYTLRILWLLRFKKTRDRSAPGGNGRTSARRAAWHSLFNVAMPWTMESTRRGLFFYLTFVIFHLGVAAGIALAFLSTVAPDLVARPFFGYTSAGLTAAGCLVGLGRLLRRLALPYLRLISTPDDYFSLAMLIVWFALGTATQAHLLGLPGFGNGQYLIAYLYLTSFFLIYVPFSKISHYLYYPFTRWWLGRALGHRGSYPVVRG